MPQEWVTVYLDSCGLVVIPTENEVHAVIASCLQDDPSCTAGRSWRMLLLYSTAFQPPTSILKTPLGLDTWVHVCFKILPKGNFHDSNAFILAKL